MAEPTEKKPVEKSLPVYSWEEVKKHRSPESLWLVVQDKVYDVTEFMEEHPGGEEVLLDVAGSDATASFEDVGHSPDARDMQKKYMIGNISEPGGEKKRKLSVPADSSSIMSSYFGIGAALLVLLFAMFLYVVYK